MGATNIAETIGLEFSDFTHGGWQKLLDLAEQVIETPEEVDFLYQQWVRRTTEPQ